MEWLAAAVERDLGLDQRQLGPGPRPHELVALVPSRWVMGLRERKVTRCSRYEASCETEIPILLQRSQVKLPAGWTRVCIQGLRKNKLGYRLATDPACYGDSMSQDSFIRAMCGVAHSNVRNLWRDAHRCLVQPYAGPVEHPQVQAVDAVRQALQKLFCVHFMSTDRVSPSLSPAREKEKENLFLSGSAAPKPNTCDSLCPNVVPPECLLESGDMLYVILPYTQYSLLDIVSYSPAKLANSHAKVLFVLYQVLIAMRACQAAGLSCGELSLMDIAVDEQLYSRLRISLSHYEELGERRDAAADHTAGKQVPRSIVVKDSGGVSSNSSSVSGHLCRDCFDELKCLALDWVHGRVSNFRYLMELNRLAGRREGDPNYHPVLPWVVDFTVPNGKFRDLRRSKFRLNKGDKQLDFTYEMTKEALAAAAAASGGSGGNLPGDLGVSVGPAGAGHADHLHVPHHISDVLSDITYYVYKARQTPKSILCSHVRSQWEPNEYPVSMERMHSWTPDECIPEFFTDPSIFRSIHPDMPDLEVPPWCGSCEEFVEVHRRLLESLEVSAQLHSWIDLTFGYKLSGKEAVKAKNVCLHLVDNHTNLSCYGVVQLFDQPHPPRLAPYQYSPPEPPYLGPTTVPSSWQKTSLNDVLDGAVPETIGSDSASWTLVGRDDDLEQGMEALDSLSAQAGTPSSTTASVPVPLANPVVGKAGLDHPGIVVSPLPGSLPTDSSGGLTNSLGSGIRSAMRGANKKQQQQQQQQHGGESNTSNPDDFKITLPEGFSPLQPLEELEKRNNFLLKGLRAQIADSTLSSKQKEQAHGTPISLANLFQRDMQALGVLVAEIFCTCKLRGIKSGSPLRQRFQAIMKLCFANLRDIPLPLHHALENLLHLHRHSKDTLHSSYPLLFQYDAICEGLPPPNPWQLLSPALSPLPFPTYFPALHKFIFSYHSKMEAPSSAQGRDIVFHLWQQLETLLQGSITAEGLEILLPFVLSLMLEESTAVYAAWYLFEPVAKVLGPRNATKYLLKPLISVYENPRCLRGRFYLYTDCFVLQLIVRLGLQAFLSCLLSHVLQVITGFEGCSRNAGSNWAGGKALRGDAGLGEDEEEDFECENGTGKAGKAGGGGGAVTGGDPGLADFSSGISLTDQVFLNEGEDFQNGFYVSSTRASGAPGDSSLPGGKQQNSPNFTGKDTDQESLSVGKLSDKSSASEVSLGDADSTRDRASLKSVDSNQDLKQTSDGEDGPELEDEEDTVDGKEGAIHRVPSLELTGCLEESGATVVTLEGEGDLLNGMEQGEPEKNMVAEDDDTDSTTEESTEKEHKILLDTVCKTVRWLSAKLGPTVTSRYVARNLLRLLTTCYVGPEKHLFVQPTEESSLESGGSVYEKKPVVGDQTASPVLECLIYVAHLYGEPVLTYQYLPYIGYLVSPPSSHRLNTRKEAGLLAAVVLTQKIIVFLSDTTLMDMLMKINQEVLLPLLHILTSPRMGFPSGVQTRSALCLKTISLMALICLRIGREMVQQHMAQTLCRFFQVFSLLHTLQGQVETAPRREVGECIFLDGHNQHGEEVTWELRVLEELQAVFNPEMAYASYIPFYCLIGEPGICKLVPNYELVWRLGQSYHDKISPGSPDPNSAMMHRLDQPPPIPSLVGQSPASGRRVATSRNPFPAPASTSTPLAGDSLPESGTFGSAMVGNRIQVSRDSETGASPNLDNWSRGHPSHHHHHHHHPPVTSSSSIFSSSSSTSSSTVPSSFSVSSSWVLGGSTSAGEESALKQNLPHSTRALQGNWLAYWQYEIGLNQQDHFHFHQIRLQSFLGHTSTVKCLAPLAGEDYFLSASKDKTVKLWPLYNYGDGTREMEPRLTYMEHRKTVTYVGQLEALQEVVSCDGTLHLWDQFTGKQIRSYEALDGKNPIIAMTTMPAPHCSVVFASADSVLRFIDPRKPGLQHEFRMAYNSMSAGLIRGLAVSPGGSTVAASFSSGFIVLLDVRTGLVLRGWPAHEGDILQMKAAEGNLIVSSSSDHALTVWKDLEQKPLQQYRAPSDPVHTLDLYGSQIVTGNVANKIGVYSMLDISASPVSLTKLSSENFRGTLTSLAVLPTKRLLLLGSENGAVRLLA